MPILHPDETLLEGRWCADGGKIEADSTALRIGHLVRDHLDRLAASADGWSILYRDRIDGRLWELTYPQSEMHGGGPPRLETIDPKVARVRFNFPAESTSRENSVGEQGVAPNRSIPPTLNSTSSVRGSED